MTAPVKSVNMGAPDASRIVWLDGLRGIAAMTVVLGHYFWGMLQFPGQDLLDPGVFAVAVFFLISGYIVPMTVKLGRDRSALRFVCSRVFRLYPLYWVSLILGAIVFGCGLRQVAANVTMVQRFIGIDDVVNVYWTLQIEILFYSVIFLSILLGVFNRPRLVIGLALVFAACSIACGAMRYYLDIRAPISLPIGMAILFIGNMKSLTDTGAMPRRIFGAAASGAGACLLAAFYLGYSRDWGFHDNPERTVISYAAAALLFFGVARLPRSWVLLPVSLGTVSYPIYLFHQPVLALGLQMVPDAGPVMARIVALLVVVALAAALHVTIEKPGVRLGRSLLARLPAPPAGRHAGPIRPMMWRRPDVRAFDTLNPK